METDRLADFAAALRPRIAGDLRLDALHRALYATDASLYREPPLGVLLPRHTDDVQAALEEAARWNIPILPRGSGSSLAGSAVGAALVIDTTRHLDQIVHLDPEAKTATVQPGVVLDDLNRAAGAHGLRFGPDPASSNRATLGGMVGTNATGTHSIQYGTVVDWVESADVLLADGSPAHFRALSPEAWAHASGASGLEGDIYRRVERAAERPRAGHPAGHAAPLAPRGRLPPGAAPRGARGRPRAGAAVGRHAQPRAPPLRRRGHVGLHDRHHARADREAEAQRARHRPLPVADGGARSRRGDPGDAPRERRAVRPRRAAARAGRDRVRAQAPLRAARRLWRPARRAPLRGVRRRVASGGRGRNAAAPDATSGRAPSSPTPSRRRTSRTCGRCARSGWASR